MIRDTNVHIGSWPFRRPPWFETADIVKKLRSVQITEAWAGSFEGLLHKDLAGVNARLAAECQRHPGFLIPFGSVNPRQPDFGRKIVERLKSEQRQVSLAVDLKGRFTSFFKGREIPADGQLPIGWSPDGDNIFTYEFGSSRLHRHSLSMGSAELAAEVECSGAALLPDGGAIVCATMDGGSDLWIARGIASESSASANGAATE